MDSFWSEMVVKIEERTALTPKKINEIASSLDALVSVNAMELGVVDNAYYATNTQNC